MFSNKSQTKKSRQTWVLKNNLWKKIKKVSIKNLETNHRAKKDLILSYSTNLKINQDNLSTNRTAFNNKSLKLIETNLLKILFRKSIKKKKLLKKTWELMLEEDRQVEKYKEKIKILMWFDNFTFFSSKLL